MTRILSTRVARALVARAFGASYLVLLPVSKCALNQPAHVLVFMRASYAFYLCNGHDVGIDVGFCSNPSHTDELTCSALDAIRLRFVPRDALSNTAVHEVMPCPSQYLLISHSFLRILTVCTVCVCVCVCVCAYTELQILSPSIRTSNIRRGRVHLRLFLPGN
jgi:hypothetical protein